MPVTPEKIKSIVKGHFERSVEPYEVHEEKYHIFDDLARHLCKAVGVREGDKVVEVGCGSGFSTVPLAETVGKGGAIWGVDNSGAMLGNAEKKLKRFGECVKLINIDAGSMDTQIQKEVDHVLFTASIFLIPDVERALSNSFSVLRQGGRIGFNYLDMILVDGRSLKDSVKQSRPEIYPYGRGINDVQKLAWVAKEAGFQEIAKGMLKRPVSMEEAISFYSIPAQSAGLFPKEELEDRRAKVKELFEHAKGIGSIEQCWGWWVGEKP